MTNLDSNIHNPLWRRAWNATYEAVQATDGEDTGSCIVLAWTEKEAIKQAMWEMTIWDSDAEIWDIKRAPEFDQWGYLRSVPDKAYYDAGWTVACNWCSLEFSKDYDPQDDWNDIAENHLPEETALQYDDWYYFEEINPGWAKSIYDPTFSRGTGKHAYCCEDHKQQQEQKWEHAKLMRSQIKAVLLSKFPGIYGLDIFVGGMHTQCEFRFPGGEYRVTWREQYPNSAFVHPVDLDAWKALCSPDKPLEVIGCSSNGGIPNASRN